jgi:DHA1 family bicyclomycin/chloramphenicol resistance-like MFS transporter
MERSRYLTLLILLGMLTAITAFSIDPTLPSMPEMAREFGIDGAAAQWSLIAFMLGLALGQLVVGPLADRAGRRPVILLSLVVYVAAALGAAAASDIGTLAGFRLLQGLAACSGQILPRSVIRDRFEPVDAARLLSYVMMIHGFAPIIGPIFGAHLAIAAGWRSIYWFHVAYGGLLLVLAWFLLAESLQKPDPRALNLARMVQTYGTIIRNPVFYGHMACGLGCFAALFIYLTTSPAVMVGHMGITGETYAYLFAVTMSGWMFGNLISARIVGKWGIGKLIRVGSALAAAASLTLVALAWGGIDHLAAIVAPMFVFMAMFSFIVPPAQAAALAPFPHAAGAASSLMGFIQLCTGAIVGQFDDGSQIPMVTAIGIVGLGPAAAYWLLVRRLGR